MSEQRFEDPDENEDGQNGAWTSSSIVRGGAAHAICTVLMACPAPVNGQEAGVLSS